MKNTINIYDFDHTIYRGDCSFDFILFALKDDTRLWKYFPLIGAAIIMYIFGLRDRKQLKQIAFRLLEGVDNIDRLLDRFWDKHQYKITQWYRDQQQSTDVVISASPEFLLRPIAMKLDLRTVIATRMDKKTGLITGENCRAVEKVRRFNEEFPDHKNFNVGSVYSDSLSDMPILELGKHAYIVKGGKRIKYEDYVPSKMRSIKSPTFVRFLFVGGINSVIGVLLSYIFSFFIDSPQLAFVVGFTSSLVPSYILNSTITFREFNFGFKKFGKFVVSYVPNFIVQLTLVHAFTDIWGLYPLVTYTITVIIAVPVTFLLLRKFTFDASTEGVNDER